MAQGNGECVTGNVCAAAFMDPEERSRPAQSQMGLSSAQTDVVVVVRYFARWEVK
jgi:hypothetical protein